MRHNEGNIHISKGNRVATYIKLYDHCTGMSHMLPYVWSVNQQLRCLQVNGSANMLYCNVSLKAHIMSFVASDSVKETDFEGNYWKLTAFSYHHKKPAIFFQEISVRKRHYGDSKVFDASHHSSKWNCPEVLISKFQHTI